jgi:hypothetical protein
MPVLLAPLALAPPRAERDTARAMSQERDHMPSEGGERWSCPR